MKSRAAEPELTDDELLEELGATPEPAAAGGYTARQERLLAGFEDIQRFFEAQQRLPRHGQDRDIFERLYAVRLDRLRAMPEALTLLAGTDRHGLLRASAPENDPDELGDDDLLAALEGTAPAEDDMRVLRHVGSRQDGQDRQEAEEIANRAACREFARFKSLFEQAEAELQAGTRQTRRFERDASVEQGDFFILGGQMVYVAEVGETIKAPNGSSDARLRVIYANGTESNLLRRSLQRGLNKDETGRRLTEPGAGPLFSQDWEEGDIASGTIYVLRSLSDHPFVAGHRDLIHKIGVTGGKVETRIAHAAQDATYLLAGVEVVATYQLAHIHRTRLEALFHRLFAAARLDITMEDRFGHPVRPREWFVVPLAVIDEAVRRVSDGSVTEVIYDPASAMLIPAVEQTRLP